MKNNKTIFTPSSVRDVVIIPSIAWPTVLLTLITIGCLIISIHQFHIGNLSTLICTLLNSILIFIIFTPMHDAAHGSIAIVASGGKFINYAIGVLSSSCFPLPYAAFRYLHLQHHKHTNHANLDPDTWAGKGPYWILPLRWITIEYRYYSIYFPILFKRPFAEATSALLQLLVSIAAIVFFCSRGGAKEVLFGWLLPGRIALFCLAYCFDYLPHRPHTTTRSEDAYKATAVTSLWSDYTAPLTWPLLHQNYHNIHHLVPYVPFYLYSSLWHSKKDDLLRMGTEIIPVLGSKKNRIE